MDPVLVNVNWVAVVLGAVVAYAFGALWYSPKMFGTKWMKAVGITESTKGPVAHAMTAQAVGTFLLAWLVGICAAADSLQLAVLVALTSAVLIKANGLFANKNITAIKIECGFVLAMVVVMVLVHAVL